MSQTKAQLIGNVSGGAVFSGIVTATSVQTGSINNGPLAGFRNAIINGNFDIWQRGTEFTGPEYGADRWLNARTGTTCTMSRVPITLGDIPGDPAFACKMDVTSVTGASNGSNLAQRIEDVRTFSNTTVTSSFWVKANATKNIAIEMVQSFGTGGSPSTGVSFGTTKVSIGTSWQKVTVTATAPSISGKTLGTDGNSTLIFRIWFDAGSNFNAITDSLGHQSGTFDIAQVQVEAGPVATPFERRPIGTELALCQRYYYRTSGAASSRLGYGYNVSTTLASIGISFPITMRTAPFALEQSGTASDYDIQFLGAATACTSVPVFTTANTVLATCGFTSSAGVLTPGQGSSARSANTNGYLGFSAEL